MATPLMERPASAPVPAPASASSAEAGLAVVREPFRPVAVSEWFRSCPVVGPDLLCEDLVSMFRRKQELECVVVCDEDRRPFGLIMKHRFFRFLGSTYGMSLFGSRPVAPLMDPNPLIVDIDIDPQELIDRALSRDEATFYDAVVLTRQDRFEGIVSVSDLLHVSRLLQKEAADRQIRTVRGTEAMIGSISEAIRNVAAASGDTMEGSRRIADMTDKGRREQEELLKLFRAWSDTADRQEQAILQLRQRAEAVESIVKLIAEMADQSNLLAINASIEAARAGQHGKGFAVVAGEVRSLADRTKRSVGQIGTILRSMTEAVRDTAELVREGKAEADRGIAQLKLAEETFDRLWDSSAANRDAAERLIGAAHDARTMSNRIREEFDKLVAQMNRP